MLAALPSLQITPRGHCLFLCESCNSAEYTACCNFCLSFNAHLYLPVSCLKCKPCHNLCLYTETLLVTSTCCMLLQPGQQSAAPRRGGKVDCNRSATLHGQVDSTSSTLLDTHWAARSLLKSCWYTAFSSANSAARVADRRMRGAECFGQSYKK